MQIILSTPEKIDTIDFLTKLKTALETDLVPVLLVRRWNLKTDQYTDLVKSIIPIAQAHHCAVLLDNLPALVRELDADGVQISTGHNDLLSAISALKPDFIVGITNLTSRHEAMLAGEAGADYISFGNPFHAPSEEARSLSNWWTNLFNVPCATFDPLTRYDETSSGNCEFLGLGENIWHADTPVAQAIRSVKSVSKGAE